MSGPSGDGVVFEGLEGGDDALVDLGGAERGVERASGRACGVAFCGKVFGDFIDVLEVGGPANSGVVVCVDDAIENHPTYSMWLHGSEGLAEICPVGEAPWNLQ